MSLNNVNHLKNPTYDYVIIGGGLSGLYFTYRLLQQNNTSKILLLEKGEEFGGRIHTFHNRVFESIESGAGRFSKVSNPLLCQLIKDLKLWSRVYSHDSHAVFLPSEYNGKQVMNSAFDYSVISADSTGSTGLFGSYLPDFQSAGLLVLDSILGDTLPNVGIVVKLLASSKLYSKKYLLSISLIDFAKRILKQNEVQFLLDSFGYYSELVIMNAYDSLKVINSLSPFEQFCGIRGGFSLIIERLLRKIKSYSSSSVNLISDASVESVQRIQTDDGFFVTFLKNSKKIKVYAKHCICAIPTNDLAKLSIFRPLKKELQSVICAPLCRIYAKYKSSASLWFKGLPKFTTDNDLRMVIPVDESQGVIMMSYTDNIYAEKWKRIFDRGGKDAVEKKLQRLMETSTGRVVPLATDIVVFFWKCGVGYWSVGADSTAISKKMIQPFVGEELFVCGENFSADKQQWMEGALETAEKVLSLLK